MTQATTHHRADGDPIVRVGEEDHAPTAETVTDPKMQRDDSDALAATTCAVCQETFGYCAITSAEAAGVSPVWALTLCTSMQRMVRRTFGARATTPEGYLAYVLLGAPRSRASREADLESLAETMW